MQIAELHFRGNPKLCVAAIKRRAEAILGEQIESAESDGSGPFLLVHTAHVATYPKGTAPAQTAILAAHQPINLDAYREDIQQSWRCPTAASLLEGSRHTLLVTEMMARLLSPHDRARLFHGVLQAVMDETQPVALVVKHSQQVLDPRSIGLQWSILPRSNAPAQSTCASSTFRTPRATC